MQLITVFFEGSPTNILIFNFYILYTAHLCSMSHVQCGTSCCWPSYLFVLSGHGIFFSLFLNKISNSVGTTSGSCPWQVVFGFWIYSSLFGLFLCFSCYRLLFFFELLANVSFSTSVSCSLQPSSSYYTNSYAISMTKIQLSLLIPISLPTSSNLVFSFLDSSDLI